MCLTIVEKLDIGTETLVDIFLSVKCLPFFDSISGKDFMHFLHFKERATLSIFFKVSFKVMTHKFFQ